MHDLGTIGKINDKATVDAITKAHGEGKYILAKYDGITLLGYDAFDTEEAAFAAFEQYRVAEGAASEHAKMICPLREVGVPPNVFRARAGERAHAATDAANDQRVAAAVKARDDAIDAMRRAALDRHAVFGPARSLLTTVCQRAGIAVPGPDATQPPDSAWNEAFRAAATDEEVAEVDRLGLASMTEARNLSVAAMQYAVAEKQCADLSAELLADVQAKHAKSNVVPLAAKPH